MIERARAEADGIVRQAESDAAALVERRTRMAEDKIAAAERAALDEVRARAAAAAAAAAERLIRDKLDAGADKAMVDATIAGLGQALIIFLLPAKGRGLFPSACSRRSGSRQAHPQRPARASRPRPRSSRTRVLPWRPHAPAAGLNASGSASIASSCCSGSSIDHAP